MTRPFDDRVAPSGRVPGGTGMLLLRGPLPEVARWGRTGVVPVGVARLDGWTVAVPLGPSRAAAPYDDALTVLAARRVPPRLAPAIGLFVIGGRAVVTVHDRSRRRRGRWVVWQPGRGLVRPPGLDVAPPSSLLRAARAGSRADVVALLAERQLPPARLLATLAAALGLPGPRLLLDPSLVGDLPGLVEREPDERHVAYFEDAVRDTVLLRRELEDG